MRVLTNYGHLFRGEIAEIFRSQAAYVDATGEEPDKPIMFAATDDTFAELRFCRGKIVCHDVVDGIMVDFMCEAEVGRWPADELASAVATAPFDKILGRSNSLSIQAMNGHDISFRAGMTRLRREYNANNSVKLATESGRIAPFRPSAAIDLVLTDEHNCNCRAAKRTYYGVEYTLRRYLYPLHHGNLCFPAYTMEAGEERGSFNLCAGMSGLLLIGHINTRMKGAAKALGIIDKKRNLFKKEEIIGREQYFAPVLTTARAWVIYRSKSRHSHTTIKRPQIQTRSHTRPVWRILIMIIQTI